MSVKSFTIAIYARLSKEDGEVLESDCKTHSSIRNQVGLIQNYIQNHQDLQWYSVVEFCDDGYSGTNFNRPGIIELLKSVNEKKIQCIVVKDFSRFGRNYLEVGNYIEKVFPVLGVRFISINDNYDNNKLMPYHWGMEAAVKNLLYDYYSKDLSQKIKASFKVKKEKGYYLGGGIPYGYLRSQTNRGQIIIDEEAAVIVQRIFQMTMEGCTRTQIAKILNEEDIPSPAEHIMKLSKNQMVWTQPRKKYYWTLDTIIRILRNQVYIGNTVNSKYQVKEIGSNQTILLPKKKWNIVLSTHEAIVTKNLFEAAQKTFNKNKTKKMDKKKSSKEGYRKKVLDKKLSGIIKGKLKCGYCNYNMDLIKAKNPYYQCISRRFLPQAACSREHADALQIDYLTALILLKFKRLFSQSTCRYDKSINNNSENNSTRTKTETRLRTELKQIKLKEMRSYEKYKNSLLSNEEYRKKKTDFCLRKNEIYQILEQMNCQETPSEKEEDSAEQVRKLANVWIKNIYFYDKNRIEIVFHLHDGIVTKARNKLLAEI